MNLASLVVKLSADASEFKKGFGDAQKQAESFHDKMDDLGGKIAAFLTVAAATGAIVKFGKDLFAVTTEAAAHAEQMEQLASRTGITANAMEGMSVALARVGLDHNSLATGMQLLSRNLIDARQGSGEASWAFEQLGIQLEAVGSNEDLLRGIADQFQAMPDGAEKTALALQLFGRSGAQLIPILNQGSAGLDDARRKAQEFGLVLTDTERSSLTKFDDKVDDLGKAVEGFKTRLALLAVDSMGQVVDGFTRMTVSAKEFVDIIGNPSQGHKAQSWLGKLADSFNQLKEKGSFGIMSEQFQFGKIQPLQTEGDRQEDKGAAMRDQFIADFKKRSAEEAAAAVAEGNRQEAIGIRLRDKFIGQQGQIEAGKRAEESLGRTIVQIEQRRQQELNTAFGNQVEMNMQRIADEQELYGLGLDNVDVIVNMLALDEERTNEKAKFISLGEVEEAKGRAALANHLSATKLLHDEEDKLITQKIRLQKGITDAAEIQWQADQSIFKSNENLLSEKMRLLQFEEEQRRAAIDRMVMTEQDRFTEMLVMEQEFDNKRRALTLQYPTFLQEQLMLIKQSMIFTWSAISQSFASTIAGLIQGTATWAQFFKSITNTILTTFINLGINMLARAALNALMQNKIESEGAAAHTLIEGVKTKATVAGEAARAAAALATSKAVSVSMLGQLSAVAALGVGMIKLMGAVVGTVVAMMGSIAAALAAGVVTAPLAVPVSTAAIGLAIAGGSAVGAGVAAITGAAVAAGKAISASMLTPMAAGGIVTGPTPILAGEAGPEAIIPLRRFGGDGETVIIVPLHLDGREVAEAIARHMPSAWRNLGAAA